MGCIKFATVVIATYLVCSLPVHCAITKDTGVCGSTKECYSIPDGCNPEVARSCRAFSSWSLTADNTSLLINLWSNTTTYIAMGFSNSGNMMDSDVYACTSALEVVRSRNAETGRENTRQTLIGVTNPKVIFVNNTLHCSFVRVLEDNSGDGTFFNLTSPNKYTPILAWGGELMMNGQLEMHSPTNRGSNGTAIDFDGRASDGNGSGGNGSHPSQKSHPTVTFFLLLCTFVMAVFFQ